MGLDVIFDAATNVATSGGESLVFHCHFYNCALQRAIEEGMGERAAGVLESAAAEAIRRQARTAGVDAAALEAQFRTLGFGVLDLGGVTATGGEAVVRASHYAMGWVAVHGERATPVCHFPAGYVRGAASALYDLPLDRLRVREVACFAVGAADCRFALEVVS